MNKQQYRIFPNEGYKSCFIDYQKLNGFKVKPLNQVEYDGIVVNQMVLIKPSFIDKVLKRKIKKKLDIYLQYMISLLDSEEDSNPSGLAEILNELQRYRFVIESQYSKFLEEKYTLLLLQKISLMEQEFKNKLIAMNMVKEEESKKRR